MCIRDRCLGCYCRSRHVARPEISMLYNRQLSSATAACAALGRNFFSLRDICCAILTRIAFDILVLSLTSSVQRRLVFREIFCHSYRWQLYCKQFRHHAFLNTLYMCSFQSVFCLSYITFGFMGFVCICKTRTDFKFGVRSSSLHCPFAAMF